MPKRVEHRGKVHSFPDSFTQAEIEEALRSLDGEAPRRGRHGLIAGLAIVIVLVVGGAFILIPPGAKAQLVTFQNVPEGATILVDDSAISGAAVSLAKGPHRVKISAPGYQPAQQDIDVAKGPLIVALELTVLPPPPPDTTSPVDSTARQLGRVLVVANESDVIVKVGERTGRTKGTPLLFDTVEARTYSFSATKEGFCVPGPRPTEITVVADSQIERSITFKRWPLFTVRSNTPHAEFRVDKEDWHPVGDSIRVEPGEHGYDVRAPKYRDNPPARTQFRCGDAPKRLVVDLIPFMVVDSPAIKPPTAPKPDAGWGSHCFKREGEWEKAENDCYYESTAPLVHYQFEVKRSGSRFGPWRVGVQGTYAECKVDDEKFQWREKGGKWIDLANVPLAKGKQFLFVRVTSDAYGSVVEVSFGAGFTDSESVRVPAKNGFGVSRDARIRGLKRLTD